MRFLKGVWTFLVGVKDALVLLLLLMLFIGLWASISANSPRISVPDGAALYIELDGTLVDRPTERSPFDLVAGGPVLGETDAALLVKVIDAAAADPKIRMIALDLDSFLGGGLANLESVGAALARFRAAGKPVETWATSYGDDGYYLAAHASSIGLSPMGQLALTGPGGTNLYFKDALDRLKVNVEVFRVGTYKSFVEPFVRNESSPEAKAADQVLADDLWASWRAGVEKQRPKLDIAATVTSWPERVAGANRDQALLARDAGLVDVVISEAAWLEGLKRRLGEGEEPEMPGDFKRVRARDYWASVTPIADSGPAVAVVHVTGAIVDGDSGPRQAGSDTVSGLIREAVADEDVQALVVRVDSGGGSATASEQIRLAMLEARARKLPVIASFGPVAASGGYWVATGADSIYASPSTITGSIGVFGIIPTFERTLKDLGVSVDGVGTTPYSGQPDIAGGLNAPTRALIQGSVRDTYAQFLNLVAGARKLPLADVERLAEGRVWSGARAKELKLVDGYGDLATAVREAGRRAGIAGEPRVKTMEQELPFLVQALGELGGAAAPPQNTRARDALARAVLVSRMRAAAQVQAAIAVASGPTVQAHCLTCLGYAVPAGTPRAAEGLLAVVKARLLD